MQKSARKWSLAAGLVLVLSVTAWAGGKNLQHFPKDISDDDLKTEMKLIKRSLGTTCNHCHQFQPKRDWTADTDTKKTARAMLDMTKKLNDNVMTAYTLGLKEGKAPKATCYLCHKGLEKPQMKPEKPEDEKKFNDGVAAGKHKKTVEAMKALVETLDKEYFTWKDAPKATCWMCHRGSGHIKVDAPKGGEDDKADGEGEKKPAPEGEKKPAPEGEKKPAPEPRKDEPY